MNQKESTITLDDVLDFYLMSLEESGIDTLEQIVKRYPQYEDDLRKFAAFRAINDLIPDSNYTDEEEDLMNLRAVSVVQNVLYQKRLEKASLNKTKALSSIRDEVDAKYISPEEFYEKTDLSEGILWTLDSRQVIFESICHKAIENIANALGRVFSDVALYLQSEMQLAPSHYKAVQAPEVIQPVPFSILIEMDEDLTEEQKIYWLKQPTIGANK